MAGRKKSDFIIVDDAFKPSNALEVLQAYKVSIIKALKDSLENVDRVSSGKLTQSIKVEITDDNNVLVFELSMYDYWKYVDVGVDGTTKSQGSPFKFKKKNVNQKAILDFIKFRGIKVDLSKRKKKQIRKTNNKTVKKGLKQVSMEAKRKQLAFLIGRKIASKGVEPTHFYSNVMNLEMKERLTQDLTQALKKDIIVSFDDVREALR